MLTIHVAGQICEKNFSTRLVFRETGTLADLVTMQVGIEILKFDLRYAS